MPIAVRRTTFAALACAALGVCASATLALAQPTVEVPGVSGDQLIFFYDARAGRVPFLSIANPAGAEVVVEVAFYPATLGSRLGAAVYMIPAGGNVVVDPTQDGVAGGAANGSAGLAVVTPIASAGSTQAVVPPEPLTGGYTLANVELAAAFGENPYGRLAVGGNGQRAAAGSNVDGDAVRYQRFAPSVLMAPVYYNPSTLAPPESDGNRVILAAFADSNGAQFDVTPATDEVAALFSHAEGFAAAAGTASVSGVLLSNLQALAGGTTLASSGKLFLDVNAGSGNVLGIFSQSLGTFAAGQRMPAVSTVPDCPIRTGTPTPTPTPTPRPSGDPTTMCPSSGMVDGTITFAFDNPGGAINISGVTAVLGYDPPLGIPGCCANPEVLERITNLTGVTGGIFTAGDNDTNEDAVDDELAVGLVALGSSIPAGPFARVRFDCTPGANLTAPLCGPDVTDDLGTQIDATCTVSFSG
jgi:hypothetical protein